MATRKAQLAGLGELLKQVRLRAGHTQQQVAVALGLECRGNFNLVSRLERGLLRNPSLGLLLDFLRACGGTLDDLKPFLVRHLSEPLPVPERRPGMLNKPRAAPEQEEDLALRKQAAFWKLQQVVEHLLHHELTSIGAPPFSRVRKDSCLFGRKLFRVLYDTRAGADKARERRLTRARNWAEGKSVPAQAAAHIEKAVTQLYREMEHDGDLDWLPLLEEARHLELLGPKRRFRSDFQMCRREADARRLQELNALQERRRPIDLGVERILRDAGITDNRVGNYRGIVNGIINACIATRPDTPERARSIALMLSSANPRTTDRTLLDQLATFIQQHWDAAPAPPTA